jgi:hypothetical protein
MASKKKSTNGVVAPAAAKIYALRVLWPAVALRLAAKQVAAHLDSGASVRQPLDEFVVRQMLREILTDYLSTLFVQIKEAAYPDGSRRLDLSIGLPSIPAHIAIEIKSDPNNLNGVHHDLMKIKDAAPPYKMMLFAGVGSHSEVKRLRSKLSRTKYSIGPGVDVTEVNRQFMEFRDVNDEKSVSFVWIWRVGPRELPPLEFQVLPPLPH